MIAAANKKSAISAVAASPIAKSVAKPLTTAKTAEASSNSKQSRVVAMLQSRNGTTITKMMKATGWQKHSVRGFLAGVVRKRLKLKLTPEKINGDRVYQTSSAAPAAKPRRRGSKNRAR